MHPKQIWFQHYAIILLWILLWTGSLFVAGGRSAIAASDDHQAIRSQAIFVKPALIMPTLGLSTAITIDAGLNHTCALIGGGSLKCWGNNSFGQIGDGTINPRRLPVDVLGLTNGVSAIAVGFHLTCIATNSGSAKCWGSNAEGQLGSGETASFRNIPVDVIGLSGVSALATGAEHVCALTTNGSVKCWGNNIHGQLGAGVTITRTNSPLDVSGLGSDVIAIAAGYYHTCALMKNGTLKCWGLNASGQLGNGTTTTQIIPTDVIGLSAVTSITLGAYHSCAIENGAAKCWGYNIEGELGNGGNTNSLIRTDVIGLSSGVSTLAAGGWHTCAVQTSVIKCWGSNSYGQLGNGMTSQQTQPIVVVNGVSGVAALTGGDVHTCALHNDGRVKCWGANGYGQLGDGSGIYDPIPGHILGSPSGVSAVDSGEAFTCAIINTGAKCWGSGAFGRLGNGSESPSATPVDVTGLANGVAALDTGYYHVCALLTDGSVRCWGGNGFGQVGDGSTVNRLAPASVFPAGSGATGISTGRNHTCVIRSKIVFCWGNNAYGQLGDSTFVNRPTPTAVDNQEVKAIAAGGAHTCELTEQGGVKCWGDNTYGQLGDGTTISRTKPVDVIGLTNGVLAISAGGSHTCALLNDSSVRCWGSNSAGQLGNGISGTQHATPILVSGVSSATAIAAGWNHTCIIANRGMLCWGGNQYGQLGDSTTVLQATPSNVYGLRSDVTAITTGNFHTCAIQTGYIKCWGRNLDGELGNGLGWRTKPVGVVFATGAAFDCGIVSDIAQSECEVLKKLYLNTDGDNWTVREGWLAASTICAQWLGVAACLSNAVTVLSLTDNNLHGSLPPELGSLTNLETLNFYNNQLNGPIPPELGNLPNLKYLSLHWNQFSGAIPAELGNLPKLIDLELSNNQLHGELPSTLSNRKETLRTLYVKHNLLNGKIPTWLGSFSALRNLDLSENQFTGGIPPELSNSSNLSFINLQNNQLSGVLPKELSKLTRLNTVYLSSNRLSGNIPAELGNLPNIVTLYLEDNQLSGEIPAALGNATTLKILAVGRNQLSGALPSALCNLTELYQLWLYDNPDLTGPLPSCFPQLTKMGSLLYFGTEICVPIDPPFDEWVNKIADHRGTGLGCSDGLVIDEFDVRGDNTCAQAQPIDNIGVPQHHNFHVSGDADWIKFNATQNTHYQVDAITPAGSTADVVFEIYATCDALSNSQAYTYTPDVRLEFAAPATGPLFLRLTNNISTVYGVDAKYALSVRAIQAAPAVTNSAVIIVAGRLKTNDGVQPNIDHAADAARQLFANQGYSDDHIYYLSYDSTHANVDAAATLANLEKAITVWAPSQVSGQGALTLYLVDHGNRGKLHLDSVNGQQLTPAQLDQWLDQLETAIPGLKVNVIIEMCYAGSFISDSRRISQPGRVVMASTSDNFLAWASASGALFSDQLFTSLGQRLSLGASFQRAREAALAFHNEQSAWLDANGNGEVNEPADYAEAGKRGFAIPGSLQDPPWAPYIAAVQPPSAIVNGQGVLQAEVRDNSGVEDVWAAVYPPSYSAPLDSEALIKDDALGVTTIRLTATGQDQYSGNYPAFTEPGVYRVVIYAEDTESLAARPIVIPVRVGQERQVYLPLVAAGGR